MKWALILICYLLGKMALHKTDYKQVPFLEDLKYFSKFDIFLQTLVNETALKSEMESMKVTFQNEIDTKASQTAIQTPEVS